MQNIHKRNRLQIDHISPMTSLGCNLNCEYCVIAKSIKNKSYAAELQKNTIQALSDGSFLNNIKTGLENLDQNLNGVRLLSLWGQEPTLTLKYLTPNIKDWLSTFPNISIIFFSTNAMDNILSIYDFITEIDKHITHDGEVKIQFSYDGSESTNNIRNASDTTILKNISLLITELNKLELKHITVKLVCHGVLSFELIKQFTSTEKIYNYIKEFDYVDTLLKSLITNPKVEILNTGLGLEQPFDASVDDGLNLATFLNRAAKINFDDLKENANLVKAFICNLVGYHIYRHIPELSEEKFIETIQKFLVNEEDRYRENQSLYCTANCGDLKVMYDGTLCGCQNLIFSTNQEQLKVEDSLEYEIKKSLIDHGAYPNIVTDNPQDVLKAIEKYPAGKYDSYLCTYHLIINQIINLAKIHQADADYLTNKTKLLIHAYLLSHIINCGYNNTVQSGSYFMRSTGFIRTFCNGALDIMLNTMKEIRQIEKERGGLDGDFEKVLHRK